MKILSRFMVPLSTSMTAEEIDCTTELVPSLISAMLLGISLGFSSSLLRLRKAASRYTAAWFLTSLPLNSISNCFCLFMTST